MIKKFFTNLVLYVVCIALFLKIPYTRDMIIPLYDAVKSEIAKIYEQKANNAETVEVEIEKIDEDTNENFVHTNKFSFNPGMQMPDGSVSYTSCLFTFEIDNDSIINQDGYIGFIFRPVDFQCDESLKDNNIYWSIAACNSETDELIPIIYNDNGEYFECFVRANDIPTNNVEIIFSGSQYDEQCCVVDDYLTEQILTKDSIIQKVKLVS